MTCSSRLWNPRLPDFDNGVPGRRRLKNRRSSCCGIVQLESQPGLPVFLPQPLQICLSIWGLGKPSKKKRNYLSQVKHQEWRISFCAGGRRSHDSTIPVLPGQSISRTLPGRKRGTVFSPLFFSFSFLLGEESFAKKAQESNRPLCLFTQSRAMEASRQGPSSFSTASLPSSLLSPSAPVGGFCSTSFLQPGRWCWCSSLSVLHLICVFLILAAAQTISQEVSGNALENASDSESLRLSFINE